MVKIYGVRSRSEHWSRIKEVIIVKTWSAGIDN